MTVLDLYNDFRAEFPDITEKADLEHIRLWDEIDPEFAYSWFGSLANALNYEMTVSASVKEYKALFEFFRSSYMKSDNDVKDCIDVSFVENLFWNVPPEKAVPFWEVLPDVLKQLYIGFHGRKPA
ncbi:DUF7674 family protein [Motilimonas cestriensis]|uniref:DUF7674 family protein n=1 Tax=Motilimonas cestriensis TaxID=2742685 RepID=UPI003DA5BD6C